MSLERRSLPPGATGRIGKAADAHGNVGNCLHFVAAAQGSHKSCKRLTHVNRSKVAPARNDRHCRPDSTGAPLE